MRRVRNSNSLKVFMIVLGVYELLLSFKFMLYAATVPIIFFMGSDANPENVDSSIASIGLFLFITFWIITPVSFILNWYMAFSKRESHPWWYFVLIPLPFIGLLIFAQFTGVSAPDALNPFNSFSNHS